MSTPNIWIVDDDESIRFVLNRALVQAGHNVQDFQRADHVLEALAQNEPDVLISDIRMPGISGTDLLKQLHADYPHIPIIMMTAHSDLDSAVSAYEGGAFEYLPKPFDIDEATELVDRALQHRRTQETPNNATDNATFNTEIIGEAPAMQEVFRAIGRLSRSNITVLINGESGTGKELVAKALHKHSPRSKNAFIALNMAAIPKDLLESELFGYEKGAFTGAQSQRKGRFEQANGGTLFLDEIGDMPAELQTRLLRVLSDGQFYRVGGTVPVQVDVRIIAATHQDLETRVQNGQFREDLFHRLNVIRIQLPALRERREDIPLLMQFFLKQSAKELNTDGKSMSSELIDWLSAQPWPGNVRQLENLSRWLTVMSASQEAQCSDLPPELLNNSSQTINDGNADWQHNLKQWAKTALLSGESNLLDKALPEFERILLMAALEATQGRKQDAAKRLGWGRNTLTRKLKDLNIEA